MKAILGQTNASKVASIGQIIVQTCRSRSVIAALQKSAYIYLQNMLSLHETHPEVYIAFKAGDHVIRRREHNWSGLSTDLVIEQVLMRSLKST